jgi:hypothetical protein
MEKPERQKPIGGSGRRWKNIKMVFRKKYGVILGKE